VQGLLRRAAKLNRSSINRLPPIRPPFVGTPIVFAAHLFGLAAETAALKFVSEDENRVAIALDHRAGDAVQVDDAASG
jgi:hypothetical protein